MCIKIQLLRFIPPFKAAFADATLPQYINAALISGLGMEASIERYGFEGTGQRVDTVVVLACLIKDLMMTGVNSEAAPLLTNIVLDLPNETRGWLHIH